MAKKKTIPKKKAKAAPKKKVAVKAVKKKVTKPIKKVVAKPPAPVKPPKREKAPFKNIPLKSGKRLTAEGWKRLFKKFNA